MFQLELNLETGNPVCSFGPDAYDAAREIIELRRKEALIYIDLKLFESSKKTSDQDHWIEIRRACKYILAGYGFWFDGHHQRLPLM